MTITEEYEARTERLLKEVDKNIVKYNRSIREDKMNWTEYAKKKPTIGGEYYVINADWSRTAHKCIYLVENDAFVFPFLSDDPYGNIPIVVTHWIKFPDFPEEEK